MRFVSGWWILPFALIGLLMWIALLWFVFGVSNAT